MCGRILLEGEVVCPKHVGKKPFKELELYPYTCKFVISQAQGKDRSRSRKGLECGSLCSENTTLCNPHMKSENHLVDIKDCEVSRFIDENDQVVEESLVMPPKQDVNTVVRCFQVRARLSKKQVQLYNKFAGDCRKTWNILVAKTRDMSPSEFLELNCNYNELRSGLVNNIPDDLDYLKSTPKDCRDYVLKEYCTAVENAKKQYQCKLKQQESYEQWCAYMNKAPKSSKIKIPTLHFRTKKQQQVIHLAKSAVTFNRDTIKVYPSYFKAPIRINNRAVKSDKRKSHDRKYSKSVADGIKHDIKLIKKRSNKFYFAIPYDVPITNPPKPKQVGSGDPGTKTFFTTYDIHGECVSYGDDCDKKIRKIHNSIDKLKSLLSTYKKHNRTYKVRELTTKLASIEDHLKNKVRDLHYQVIKEIVQYKRFYYPKFNNKQMEQRSSTLKFVKREMNAVSHYQMLQRLKSKAEEVGSTVLQSDEYRTTQVCGKCLKRNFVGFARQFNCHHCNYSYPRDANAARNNILKYIS